MPKFKLLKERKELLEVCGLEVSSEMEELDLKKKILSYLERKDPGNFPEDIADAYTPEDLFELVEAFPPDEDELVEAHEKELEKEKKAPTKSNAKKATTKKATAKSTTKSTDKKPSKKAEEKPKAKRQSNVENFDLTNEEHVALLEEVKNMFDDYEELDFKDLKNGVALKPKESSLSNRVMASYYKLSVVKGHEGEKKLRGTLAYNILKINNYDEKIFDYIDEEKWGERAKKDRKGKEIITGVEVNDLPELLNQELIDKFFEIFNTLDKTLKKKREEMEKIVEKQKDKEKQEGRKKAQTKAKKAKAKKVEEPEDEEVEE
jgi:hypothetical protein